MTNDMRSNMDFGIRLLSCDDGKMLQQTGRMLGFLQRGYPNFRNWYIGTVLREIYRQSPCRQIYVAAPDGSDEIAGVMILKNTAIEKKICTLFVAEPYRSQHLGMKLVLCAMDVLETDRPVITVSDIHQAEFEGLFRKFGFVLHEKYQEYYQPRTTEYAYNGPINPAALEDTATGV